jgi:phosphatidylglycerophosphatase A
MREKIKNIFIYAICSVGGSGYFPKAPGTFASLLATITYFFVNPHWQTLSLLIVTSLVLGILLTPYIEQNSGKDPSLIVIDEVAGQWLAFLFLPQNNLAILITGFILFRIFDIWKPLGINKLQSIKSGWGVMLDDILAGVYANIILQVLIFYGVFG